MPSYPKDFTLSSELVDPKRFDSVLADIVDSARQDPLSAMARAINTTTELRSAISRSSSLLRSSVLPLDCLSSVASSLATLRQPMEAFASANIAGSFANTINSLATLGNIGLGVQNVLNSDTFAAKIELPELSLGAAAFQLGVLDSLKIADSITAPYLASSSAVFQLETSFSKLLAHQPPAISNFSRTITQLSQVTALQTSVLSISTALKDTWDSISYDASRLSLIPAPILRAPAVELYSVVQTSAAISLPAEDLPEADLEVENILQEAVDMFPARLATVHPDLVATYRGGIDALKANGTDWQRHAMVSFRELCTHTLHLLAPDDRVMKTVRVEDVQNGRPTRRARLNYIFAEVAGAEIAKFYDADMKAAIELFDTLSKGTHKLAQAATPKQLHYLRGRVVGFLTAMLEARGF